jgi:glycine/D-amino acid oxidase-like deaminating enzyme
MERWDAVVVGGGFYGLYLAEFLAKRLPRVLLCERGPAAMTRASYSNQARVHNGYHYPRSVLTALRSRVNAPRFSDEFGPAVRDNFAKLYAIPRQGSKVTAEQFAECMRRIGAPIRVAADRSKRLFDPALIEEVFLVRETAFDAVELRCLMQTRAVKAGATLRFDCDVLKVEKWGGGIRASNTTGELNAGLVVNCTYAQTNAIAARSGLPVIPLKHELAEMALVQVPERLRELGITVMDGPFFSCMPFPPRGLHTLSHVRYTPHGHWHDSPDAPHRPAYKMFEAFEKRSAYPHMVRDAARYLPLLANCEYRDSLWEVKTVLPRSENDDSRPILFRPHHGLPNYHVVMGGKIDNVYDVADELTQVLSNSDMRIAA